MPEVEGRGKYEKLSQTFKTTFPSASTRRKENGDKFKV